MADLDTLVAELRESGDLQMALLAARDEVSAAETPFYRAWFPVVMTTLGLVFTLLNVVVAVDRVAASSLWFLAGVAAEGIGLYVVLILIFREMHRRDRRLADAQQRVRVVEALVDGRI